MENIALNTWDTVLQGNHQINDLIECPLSTFYAFINRYKLTSDPSTETIKSSEGLSKENILSGKGEFGRN